MAKNFFMLTAKKGGSDSHWDATPPAAMLESVCDGSPSNIRKGAWSETEDVLLRQCIEKYGEGNWHKVPLRAGLQRCRKSCRLRWLNYLSPNIKRGEFSSDEVELLIRMHKLLGNRWSLIAGRLPGRTANDIKNYWNTHLSKHFAVATKPTKSTLKLPITPFKPIATRPSLLERELLLKMSAMSIPPAPMPSTVVTDIMPLQPSKLVEHSKQEADEDYSQWLSQLCNALDEDILLKENGSINSELDFNNIDQIDYWDDLELWSRLASLGKEGQRKQVLFSHLNVVVWFVYVLSIIVKSFSNEGCALS